ncbi:Protein-glucosylgalactosylhydroxylysine glucosidase [Mactra antiquata]
MSCINTLQCSDSNFKNTAKDNDWKLCSDSPPKDKRMWPSLGNGHVGFAAQGDTIYMNGLYNGNGTTSTRARIPAFISVLLVATPEPGKKTYCLDMKQGIFVVTYTIDHLKIELKTFAHRNQTRLLVTQISIITDGLQPAIQIPLYINHGMPSDGINLINKTSDIPHTRYTSGKTKEAETPESGHTPVHVYYSVIPTMIMVKGGSIINKTNVFLMSVSPFQHDARASYIKGLRMIKNDTLESTHVKAWNNLWNSGKIDIYGNKSLASLTYSSLYYIYSALPTTEELTWPFVGLSPSDLAHNGYNGHVFWDQDTWMYPPILLLHNNLARTLIKTRLRTLDSAIDYARLLGMNGARYPWESALSGYDVTPSEDCRKYEIHVNGDIAVAIQQYLMISNDNQIHFTTKLKSAIFALADYWISRSTFNVSRDKYEILDVMPPDEWNFPVNNSVYTNYVAKKTLQLAGYYCKRMGCVVPSIYNTVADKLVIPFDSRLQYHPEYEGYNNVTVKQADAILLGWPLDMKMSLTVRKNDLDIYSKVTPAGPAMSWGMFAIGWLDVGKYEKATISFYKQQENRKDPFNMWTENSDGTGATNFITGMGGYLQSVVFGYAGVRIRKHGLIINCQQIPYTTGYRLKNVDYHGNSIDIVCNHDNITLTIIEGSTLMSVLLANNKTILLLNGSTLRIKRQKVTIMPICSQSNLMRSENTEKNINIKLFGRFIVVLVIGSQICVGFLIMKLF